MTTLRDNEATTPCAGCCRYACRCDEIERSASIPSSSVESSSVQRLDEGPYDYVPWWTAAQANA